MERYVSGPRTENAVETRILMRKSVWCGAVSALLAVLIALNLTPTTSIQYQVKTEVVLSPLKFEQLKKSMLEAEGSPFPTNARMIEVAILDSEGSATEFGSSSSSDMLLLEVTSVWKNRCQQDDFEAWLDELTRVPLTKSNSDVARDHRLASWEMQLAQHYLNQHDQKQKVLPPTAARKNTFQLAGYSTEDSTQADVEARTRSELLKSVEAAKTQLFNAEVARREQVTETAGELKMTDSLVCSPLMSPTPRIFVFSVIVLALASGMTAGLWQYRLTTGGVYEPESVAVALASKGIVTVDLVKIPDELAANADWIEHTSMKASRFSRSIALRLVQIGEWGVGIWFAFFVCRLIFDPMWRSVLWSSPLAALGRLLIGMP